MGLPSHHILEAPSTVHGKCLAYPRSIIDTSLDLVSSGCVSCKASRSLRIPFDDRGLGVEYARACSADDS